MEMNVVDDSLQMNTKTQESASLSCERRTREPSPELICDRSTTNNAGSAFLCCSERKSAPSQIVNPTSAALSLWDTSGCCALLRKVGGNCCGCGGNPCVFETISKTQTGLAKR